MVSNRSEGTRRGAATLRGLAAAAVGAGCLFALLAAPPRPSAAQGPPNAGSAAPAQPPDTAATVQRKSEIEQQIAALRAAPDADRARLTLLERLERVLSQSLDEIARGEALDLQLEGAQRQDPQSPAQRLGHPPPYTMAEYDAALASRDSSEQVLHDLEEAAEEAATALEAAHDALARAQRDQRESPGARDGPAALSVELAAAEHELRRRQSENSRLAVEVQKAKIAALRDDVDWIEGNIAPQPEELSAALTELDAAAAALSRRREQADVQLQVSQRRWEDLASRASAAQSDAAIQAELAARRTEYSLHQKKVAFLGEQIDRLERSQEIVRQRFAVHGPDRPDRAELTKWQQQSRDSLASMERELRLDRAEQAALSQERRTLGELAVGDPEREWQDRQVQALAGTVDAYESNIESLEQTVSREKQLQESLGSQLDTLNLAERAAELRSMLGDVWRFEITSSEDRSITVGKIATGLIVFFVGLFLARIFTHWFGPRIMRRLKMDEGAANAYQSLAYYALLAIVFLTALRIVDIPLTAFAVVGGALAIGVGFGSQNIVNNFISGLILLAERPIKRGDLVELEGTYGNIERIGLRSTRVRTGDNIHVIVPNSAFLENRVINWTHTDRQVRIKVAVGVVYGSPTREVERLIRQALEEHPDVLPKPEPIILFTEFGDNSLNFEARFWVVIQSLIGRLRIESAIRFRIDDLFREADIVIAFPQRDVHLDATTPIPVRLTREPTDTEGED